MGSLGGTYSHTKSNPAYSAVPKAATNDDSERSNPTHGSCRQVEEASRLSKPMQRKERWSKKRRPTGKPSDKQT